MLARDTLRVDPLFLEMRWRREQLCAIALRWSRLDDRTCCQTEWGMMFAKCLEQYLAGQDVLWPDVPLDWDQLSQFSRNVLRELRLVPRGAWLSYGDLAARCGKPGAARAVGRVMARNPWPLLFPCHRVLGRHRQLTGFGPGLDMKYFLLTHEKILENPQLAHRQET